MSCIWFTTRIGFAEGVWMGGVIDEIRMSGTETLRNPTLVETKTRVLDTLPAESQRRNARYALRFIFWLLGNEMRI